MAKSKSSSKSSQSSNTTDNKVVTGDNSVTATGGSTINYLSSDIAMEALDTAVELGKASIGQSGDVLAGVLKLADQNAMITENSRIGNNNLARDLATTAIDKVVKNNESADVQVLGVVGKYGAWIVGGIAVIVGLFLFLRPKPKN